MTCPECGSDMRKICGFSFGLALTGMDTVRLYQCEECKRVETEEDVDGKVEEFEAEAEEDDLEM